MEIGTTIFFLVSFGKIKKCQIQAGLLVKKATRQLSLIHFENIFFVTLKEKNHVEYFESPAWPFLYLEQYKHKHRIRNMVLK